MAFRHGPTAARPKAKFARPRRDGKTVYVKQGPGTARPPRTRQSLEERARDTAHPPGFTGNLNVWRTGTACARPSARTSCARAARGSRVKKPSFFSRGRSSALNSTRARAMPRRTAPAWPAMPPPPARISRSNLSAVSVAASDCRTTRARALGLEIILERAAVDRDLALAGPQEHARHRSSCGGPYPNIELSSLPLNSSLPSISRPARPASAPRADAVSPA